MLRTPSYVAVAVAALIAAAFSSTVHMGSAQAAAPPHPRQTTH